MMEINYQEVVSLIIEVMRVTYPIVLIFLVAEKLINLFTSMVFGKEVKI